MKEIWMEYGSGFLAMMVSVMLLTFFVSMKGEHQDISFLNDILGQVFRI